MIGEFESEVLEIRKLTPKVREIKFSTPEDFEFKAGQFVSVTFYLKERNVIRPYSIASSPSSKFMNICIKNVGGEASKYFFNLKVGKKVNFISPMGSFILKDSSKNKDIIFLCVGTGIAPYMSMIFDLLEKKHKRKIVLIKGERSEENSIYDKELKELEKYPNFKFYNILSQPKNKNFKNKGYIQDFIEEYANYEKGHFYICGLSGMIRDVKKLLEEKKIGEEIFFEQYD